MTAVVTRWRRVRPSRLAVQLLVLLAVAWMLSFFWTNLQANLKATGLPTDYGYLDQPYGSDIPGSAFRPNQSVADALRVGYGNTLRIAFVGIVLALIIGVLIGVGRLSTNFLVRTAAAVYVETFRNIPPYLLVFASFFVVVQQALPPINEAIQLAGATVFSNRGLFVPWLEARANAAGFVGVLGVGLALALAVAVWRTRRFSETGEAHHRVLWGLGVLGAIAVAGYLVLGQPVALDLPEREGRLVLGGIEMHPSYAALLIALTLYTASHIAEIVRGSIQAVPHGQSEACCAIGLSNAQRIRLVVLPQAFRIAVPPLANQFLNLTKNSSLAVAIGYYEITRVTQTAANNAAPAPQAYSVLMLLYLSFSLSISLITNLVNRRLLAGDALMTTVEGAITEEFLPPPVPPAPGGRFRDDPRAWAKVNLVGSVPSTIATVVFGALFAYAVWRALRYVFLTGRWDVVRSGLTSLTLGLNYPRDTASLVRPWLALAVVAVIGGLVAGVAVKRTGATWAQSVRPWFPVLVVGALVLSLTRTPTPKLAALGVVAAFVGARQVGARLPDRVLPRLWLVHLGLVLTAAAALTGLEVGAWDRWGGLLLALYVAVLGIVVSFPLGMLLALGRRSSLPVVRVVSVTYIELIRGVPLITLLFAGDLALRFFLPEGADPPTRVNRAVIMVILFSAAYLAEIIRAGLQSVPKGQLEAAQAISLGPIVTLRKVVLPQALRAVIPAIVGQFISLFKDTTLLTIIGLHELIGVAETVTAQQEFRNQGLLPEVLTFAGLLFWVCCYSMSKASQRLETRMGVGVR